MDRVGVEMVGPMMAAERRREAERERLLVAVDRAGRGRPLAGVVGRLLVRAGGRLEAAAAPRAVARPFSIVADPCGGCAN